MLNTFPDKELYVVLDNGSSHRSKRTLARVSKKKRIHLIFTPTHASWLNRDLVQDPDSKSGSARNLQILKKNWSPNPRVSSKPTTKMRSPSSRPIKEIHWLHDKSIYLRNATRVSLRFGEDSPPDHCLGSVVAGRFCESCQCLH